MRPAWVDAATGVPGSPSLADLVQASRLLGGDPYLVLHGGGNSSAKDASTVYVKASGHDMATIGPDGFAPLDRRALDRLLDQESMTDPQMVAGLRAALLDPASATPSIETLLHNLLPHESVLHTHADAIVTLTNARGGGALLTELAGDDVLRLGYCMPGFDLARLVRTEWAEHGGDGVRGIVLAHHGLFTFAADARTAYESHVQLVDRAEQLITEATGVRFADDPSEVNVSEDDDLSLRELGDHVRAVTGNPVRLWARRSEAIEEFCAHPALERITQQGPSTLEHVIRTKRTPLLGRDVAGYAVKYAAYVARNRDRSTEPVVMLDPTPRVILEPGLGLVTTGRTLSEAQVAADIYRHTMRIVLAAEALGGYRSITEGQAFDIEYWELEQAKVR